MSDWTREHDRILAERCEGLNVRRWDELSIYEQHYDHCPDELFVGDSIHDKLAHYNVDPVACLQAAEAWRLRKPDREYRQRSKHNDEPEIAKLFEQGQFVCQGAGLYWALYEAAKL